MDVLRSLTASYLGDALGVLLEAVGSLLEGAGQARCSWVQEPGESRWIFQRAGSQVRLRVLAFHDAERAEPDNQGRVVFDSTIGLTELAQAVARGAQRVLDRYGEQKYLRPWVESPFPVSHLDLIHAHLASA